MKKIAQLLEQLHNKKITILLLLDFILLPLALFTSVLLRLGGNWDHRLDNNIWLFLALPLWTIPIFINLGLYKAIIKYLDEKIVFIVFIGVSLSVLILSFILYLNKIVAFPLTSIIIFWILALAYIGGTRIILRGILRNFSGKEKIRVAIYGAGSAGIQVCLALQNDTEYEPIAFFDDALEKWNSTIRGIAVYNAKDLAKVVKIKQINQILLAIPSAPHARKKEIIEKLEFLSLKIKPLPSITEIIKGTVTINDIKEAHLLNNQIIQQTPSTLLHLVNYYPDKLSDIICLVGGEALPPSIAEKLIDKFRKVINVYGPAETVIWSSSYEIKDSNKPYIGKPLFNEHLYILSR